jgi:thiol-disulfide isomerase/thioredoxin
MRNLHSIPLAILAVVFSPMVVAGCERAEAPAAETAAAASSVAQPVAEAPGLPRDQWLKVETAKPLDAEGAVVRDEKRRPYSYELLGEAVPAFKASLVGGGEATEEVLRGKWTIVDVWGIWCGDCRRDAEFVKQLAAQAEADPDIDFLSIHTPPNRERADEAYGQFGSIETYFESLGGGWPTIVDTDASLREALKIRWTPTYLLVGPDLTVRAFRTDISVGGEGNASRVLDQARAIRKEAGL